MAKFTDHTGHEWQVELFVGHLKPLRESHGLNTRATAKDFSKQLGDLIGDEEKLYEVLLLLCERQLKERGIGPEDFAFLLGGVAIRDAAAAVVEAIESFRQGPSAAKEKAAGIRAVMEQADEATARDFREKAPSLISRLFAGSSPESSESTPTPEPSAS
jgi:hypothetical protein